jgi:hypothetical protein
LAPLPNAERKKGLRGNGGFAMVFVMVVITILAMFAVWVTIQGYNQRKLLDVTSGQRAKLYYRAQAGVVEAAWRIRDNYTSGIGGVIPPGGFPANDTWNPPPYSIDVDGVGGNDTSIDIDAVVSGTLKNRPVRSAGCEDGVTMPCIAE